MAGALSTGTAFFRLNRRKTCSRLLEEAPHERPG
jgi:hypothetical protein